MNITSLLLQEISEADCTRRKVGAVLVLDGVVVGKGHNRLPRGSCEAGACPRGQMSYAEQPADVGYEASGCHSLHAEDNALAEAGLLAAGATAYISEWPCPRCEDRLKEAGVARFLRVILP